MAEQNCSSPSSPAPVVITSTTEHSKSDIDDSNSLSSSCDSKNFAEKSCSSGDESACKIQSPQSNSKLLFCDPTISSSSENKNKVSDTNNKNNEKSISFLRPSILSSGFSSFTSKNVDTNKADSSFSLQCPKLNLAASKFGNSSFTKSLFSSSVSFGNNKNEVPSNSTHTEASSSGDVVEEKSNKPTLGLFSSNLNSSSNSLSSTTPKSSVVSVPNFVFGENLHERVTDSVKVASAKDKAPAEIKSNGTSDMLFTSVINSKEGKETANNDTFTNSKESSSLIEDAARCQEARTNKRKYEEVLVTTGEEDEQNVLQVNVKLFAFDNGAWVERGRGILRLNDKNCDEGSSSRIVIRTVGSLRVVLNTKIWSGMSLSRASERSIRLTAMDANGQVKIFLIQASLKDMTSLYSLLEERIKLCNEKESESDESPQKKIALEKEKV